MFQGGIYHLISDAIASDAFLMVVSADCSLFMNLISSAPNISSISDHFAVLGRTLELFVPAYICAKYGYCDKTSWSLNMLFRVGTPPYLMACL